MFRCYAAGAISGTSNLRGLIAGTVSSASTVVNSYHDSDTTGRSDTGRGTGKTTIEMQQEATFTGFDFTNIWDIDEGSSYPYLQWEN